MALLCHIHDIYGVSPDPCKVNPYLFEIMVIFRERSWSAGLEVLVKKHPHWRVPQRLLTEMEEPACTFT